MRPAKNKRTPYVLFAFANEHEARHLALEIEMTGVQEALREAEDKGWCKVLVSPRASLDSISQQLIRYGDRLAIFHFAGHAGSTKLLFENTIGGNDEIRADAFAKLLTTRRPPDIVMLNGCYSADQAQRLLDLGVLAVIGTTAAVKNSISGDFATWFYNSLAMGDDLRTAFNFAKNRLVAKHRRTSDNLYRDSDAPQPIEHESPWELYSLPEFEQQVAQWRLPALKNPERKPVDVSLLGCMVDRREQMDDLRQHHFNRYNERSINKAWGVLIFGAEDEGHEFFARRLHEWEIPNYLRGQLNLDTPVKRIDVRWSNDHQMNLAELSEQCLGQRTGGVTNVKTVLNATSTPLLITTSIYKSDWAGTTPLVIEQWFDLVAGLCSENTQQILIGAVLLRTETRSLAKRLQFWRPSSEAFAAGYTEAADLHGSTLRQLNSVPVDEVNDAWLDGDFSKQLKSIVGTGKTTPQSLVSRLRPFVRQLYKDEARNNELPMKVLTDGLVSKLHEILESEAR